MNSVSLAATPSFNRATIYAAGRGKPLINLSDEKTLIQTFAGEESLVSILGSGSMTDHSNRSPHVRRGGELLPPALTLELLFLFSLTHYPILNEKFIEN